MSCIFAYFDARRKPLDKRAPSYISPLIFPQLDNSGTNFLFEPRGQYLKLKLKLYSRLYSSKGYKTPPHSLWFQIIW